MLIHSSHHTQKLIPEYGRYKCKCKDNKGPRRKHRKKKLLRFGVGKDVLSKTPKMNHKIKD